VPVCPLAGWRAIIQSRSMRNSAQANYDEVMTMTALELELEDNLNGSTARS